jgi:6-phosphogluconolactonase
MRFWVGGYTADAKGEATGIGVLDAVGDDHAAGALGFAGDAVAASGSPSWVAVHPSLDVVYAAHEAHGTVRAYRRTGEQTLVPLGAAVDAGALTCHVAVSPEGSSLIASCWGDGRVVQLALDAAGGIRTARVGAAASDPYGEGAEAAADIDLAAAAAALREAAGEEFAHLVPAHDEPEPATEAVEGDRVSRAHQAVHLPGGLLATTDMGFDLVRIWKATSLKVVQQVVLPRGSGPRHMRWHPSGHLYVLTELSQEVFVLAPDREGRWRIVSATPIPGVLPGDTAAELAPSRRNEFLYAGIRGSNTIATLRVRGAGEALEVAGLDDAGVDWPRNHLVVDDILLVAGQRSNEVVSRRLDERTGIPGPVRHRTTVPTPTCLTPA